MLFLPTIYVYCIFPTFTSAYDLLSTYSAARNIKNSKRVFDYNTILSAKNVYCNVVVHLCPAW